MISKFTPYSLGIVAANKPQKDKDGKFNYDIEVVLTEQISFISGEITDNVSKYQVKGQSGDGSSYQVDLDTTPSVSATWLPIGTSNRLTAPDVRRGEEVLVWRMADTDKYWWCTNRQQQELRRLETVVFGISATREEGAVLSHLNMYLLEISSHAKHVMLTTTKEDGEPFAYTLALNTQDGNFVIQDDDGQIISLDSKERRLELKNKDGSFLDIFQRNIHMHAVDTLKQTATNIVQESTNHRTTTTNLTEQSSNISATHSSGEITVNGITHTQHKHKQTGHEDQQPTEGPEG